MRWTYQLQLSVNVLNDKLYGDFIVTAAWHNDIGMGHSWRDVIAIGRFHHTRILFDDALDFPASHRDISAKQKNIVRIELT